MSHELEIVDGRASFAFNHQNGAPWHGLGTSVERYMTADEALKLANADYEVWLEPVYVKDERTGAYVPVPQRFATVRISPKDDHLQPFEVFRGRYTTQQNREVFDRALAIVDASGGDFVVDTVGVLNDGARFFASIDLGTLFIDPAGINDEIARYLLVKNSHDGSGPVLYANTDIRVVCNNTLRMAERGAKATVKARHTPNADIKLEEARKVLNISVAWGEHFKAEAEKMLAIPMTSGRLDKVLDHLWPAKDADTDRKAANRTEIVDTIKAVYTNDRNAGRVGNNGWGAYNAITEYLDWHRKGSVKTLVTASMDEVGVISRKKVEAQRAILALAN